MTPRRTRVLLSAILAVAAALRLAHWWAVRGAPFFAQLVMDSEEYDRWARQLAAGDWLGSGAFFQAPLYPYLLAVVYRLGGHSLDLVYLLQIALAVTGCWALYRAGGALAGEAVGLAAAALAALYGPFVFYDVQIAKESLAVTVVCFLLWRLVALGERPSLGGWLGAGALAGLLALLRENALLVVPLLLPLAWRGPGAPRRAAGRAGALLLGVLLALAPVGLRNLAVGGGFLLTTFQGGVNFYIGNNPDADGTYRPIVPGKQIPALERAEPVRLAEQALGGPLSPHQVSRYWLGRALAWARAEPVAFLALQARKLGLFWSWYEWPDAVDYYYVRGTSPALRLPLLELGGVTLLALAGLWLERRRLAVWAPVLVWTLGWTASVVAFFLFSRYRLPVVPALLLAAAVPVARLGQLLGAGRLRAAAPLALLLLAAWWLPRLAAHPPRMDLVDYNLGRIQEGLGRESEALASFQRAFAANPRFLSPCLALASAAARRGDLQAALEWSRRAVAVEPRSDDAWTDLGAALLAAGRLGEAAAALDRALALDPTSLLALHDRALVAARAGDREAARELNRRLLEIAPAYPPALRLRERLREPVRAPPGPPGNPD